MPGVKRIGPKRPRKVYLAEWREARGLTQVQLGDRLGVTDVTVSRWETGRSKLSDNVRAAISEALGIEPGDLDRHPDQISADALLRDQPAKVRDAALAAMIDAINRHRRTG